MFTQQHCFQRSLYQMMILDAGMVLGPKYYIYIIGYLILNLLYICIKYMISELIL